MLITRIPTGQRKSFKSIKKLSTKVQGKKQVIESLSYHDSNAFSNNNIIMYGVIKHIDSQ